MEMSLPHRDDFFCRIYLAQEPIVFRNVLPVIAPDKLLGQMTRLAGERIVPVRHAGAEAEGTLFSAPAAASGEPPIRATAALGPMRLADFISQLRRASTDAAGAVWCVESASIPETLPELASLFQFPLAEPAFLFAGSPRLWVSATSQFGPLHFDRPHNFGCLYAGTKRLTLFPPRMLPDLYVGPLDDSPVDTPMSLVDLRAPDLERFPRFAAAWDDRREVELHAGDVVYIPASWWHAVESQGTTVFVNYWWHTQPLAQLQACELTFFEALRTLRRLPKYLREPYRVLFETFVFERHGDPCAHLALDQQGIGGEPTAEGDIRLERVIAALQNRMGRDG